MTIGCFDGVKKYQVAKQSMGGGWIPTASCVNSKLVPYDEVSSFIYRLREITAQRVSFEN